MKVQKFRVQDLGHKGLEHKGPEFRIYCLGFLVQCLVLASHLGFTFLESKV